MMQHTPSAALLPERHTFCSLEGCAGGAGSDAGKQSTLWPAAVAAAAAGAVQCQMAHV